MNSYLYSLVTNAMQNAAENGERFDGWLVEEIAEDMLEYDADISGHNVDDVIACILEYRNNERV